ncbi:hypothetical protein [Streptomyces eurythermus]
MSGAIAAMVGVAVTLPACSIAGAWMINRATRTDSRPQPPYPCARCDKPNLTYAPLTRCGPCEAKVFDIMIAAAERGHVLPDPLTEARRWMQAKGLL